MKSYFGFVVVLLALVNCRQKQTDTPGNIAYQPQVSIVTDTNFFPVTTFIKGRIAEIKSGGINPLMRTAQNGRGDSAWLNMNQLDTLLAEFYEPCIDTANLKDIYVQRSFLDQTINAFTFSYDPRTTLADTVQLRRWDVYVDPESQKVSRIFMLKNKAGGRVLQLTWQDNKQAKIVSIKNINGVSSVEKETSITWDLE